jgi:hypothetical protein
VKIDFKPSEDRLDLEFETIEAIEAFFTQAQDDQAFFVELESEPAQFQAVRATAIGPSLFRFRFDAEVVQTFPGAAAFRLVRWGEGRRRELSRRLAATDEEAEAAGEMSPIFRIKQMNPNQRFRLAMKGSRVERGILMRDTSPEVLAGLLSHPRVEEKEILEIVKSPYASGGILKRVGDNRKWMNNADIRLAVVKSPKTPLPLAVKHLHVLRTTELQTLAKMGNAREMLRKEALKIYLKRIGNHPGG